MSEPDLELLKRYACDHAEDAFAEIVRRHLDLVYSAALRQVRSPQLAEEVAQSTFVELARNAHRFTPDTLLTAWLYEVARRTAIDVVRREARRQAREQIASEMNAINASGTGFQPVFQPGSQPVWPDIEPLLDEAMSALDDTDRVAVLLRYFENKPLREVGATLGTSEDAAQKRVSRAVERLREFFAKHGVTIGASGLTTVIAANAVQAAPVGLAVTISTAATLAETTVVAAATASLTKTIAMTTLQKTLITGIVLACVVTPLVVQRQTQARLREQDEALRRRSDQLAQLAVDNERLSNVAARANSPAVNGQLNDLLKLRAEAESLRGRTRELAVLREENRRLQPLPSGPETPIQITELVQAKDEAVRAWMRAFIAYARENLGQLPATFQQAEPFWPKDVRKSTSASADQFEILFQGSIHSLTNLDVVVFREKKPWPHRDGKWGRFYGMADGHAQYCSSSDKTADGNFDAIEKDHAALPTGL